MKIIVAFDVETSGFNLINHDLMAVGLVAYKYNSQKNECLETLEVHINGPLEDGQYRFDPITKAEFWNRNQKALDIIMIDRKSPEICAGDIIDFLIKYQQYAITHKGTFIFVTDNCWFDCTWLSYFLCKYDKRGQPIRQNYFTGYMPINNVIDISQCIRTIKSDICLNIDIKSDNTFTPHDHTPVNDAKGIAEKYFKYIKNTKMYRSK